MSLVQEVVNLAARSGHARDETNLSLFYIGVAIGAGDPEAGRRILRQLEREMGAASGQSPEAVEVSLRAASRQLAGFLDHAIEEEPA